MDSLDDLLDAYEREARHLRRLKMEKQFLHDLVQETTLVIKRVRQEEKDARVDLHQVPNVKRRRVISCAEILQDPILLTVPSMFRTSKPEPKVIVQEEVFESVEVATPQAAGPTTTITIPGRPAPPGKSQFISRKTPLQRHRTYRITPPDADGSIKLSAKFGDFRLLNLGTISTAPGFHTDRYVYPVGYRIARYFCSTTDPKNDRVCYICSIEDFGDDKGPVFQITCPEDPRFETIQSPSLSGAFARLFKPALIIRQKPEPSAYAGPDFFGLTHSYVSKLLQDLPNVRACTKYKWQTFEEMTKRGGKTRSAVVSLKTGSIRPYPEQSLMSDDEMTEALPRLILPRE